MKISRRSALRGLGVSLSLPALESFGRSGTHEIPLRMGFTYIPNGVIMDEWRPQETGKLTELPNSLKPLQNHTNDFQVMSGWITQKLMQMVMAEVTMQSQCHFSYRLPG